MGLTNRVRILAWVHIVLGGIGLAPSILLVLAFIVDRDEAHRAVITNVFAPILGMLALVYFIPSFVGGIGLLRGKPWARAVIWIEAAFLAPLIPVGTLLAGLTLWALPPNKLFPGEDGGMGAFNRMLARAVRPAVLALAALATLATIIGLGYVFRDQVEQIDTSNPLVKVGFFVVGVAIVVVVGTQLGWAGGSGISLASIGSRQRAKREQERVIAEHKARLARLAADPARAKYAAEIERGEYWSDEQIAYDLDRSARTMCQHLRPIEGEMREAGVALKWLAPGWLRADCRINEAALNLAAGGLVTYTELIEPGGRSYEDKPYAALACTACNTSIRVLNEHDAWPGIRYFPER
jgi:hypothetical protein